MKLSEKIAGIILIAILILASLGLMLMPIVPTIGGYLFFAAGFITCYGLVPMGLYGLVSLIKYCR